jgi:hypothetical protein
MKKTLAVVIALILLLTAVVAAQAQDETLIFLLWSGAEYTVNPDETVYLVFGWGACNQGLLKAAQNAFGLEITLDGEPFYQMVKKDPYWGAPYPIGPFEECIPAESASPVESDWFFPLDLSQFELDEEYEFSTSMWVDHQITDGFDSDGDGKPDFYSGVLYSGTVTLTVTETP